ncbi:ABC transporter ATP-binding protein [Bifidobacterium sp. ESL0775]|uniref:ABC transporter ATP-binding protein n=1 Tax=Bifidobacterium sp. ESL0775 TaxID=2983230 RepID=UPI0023FA3BE1|nr:ABC transporter ATP-binding protein [Bifidobacterium sp. ESL0775]WEV70078.1 ABC transporter ATP-binding protein [Bifidobacterium sp. ESL0775]
MHNLRKVYAVDDDKVVALARINLEIPRGQICCIFGESGSGKSTLLNQMAGMEKPTKGSVHIGHNNISQMSERELAAFRQRHIGFVFQSYNLLPHLTAVENVAMPLMFCGIDKVAREAKASKMLKRVGLGKRLKHFPSQMSGGQQQRVGIARAFIAKPEVVFADEPTGNLDSKTKNEVMTMMCAFARHYRQTLVLVTHDEHMAQYADRIVTLFDGHIVGDVMTENIAVQNHDFIDTGFLRPSVSIPHITATSGDGQADLARLANANSQQQTIRAKEPRQ